MKRLHWVIVLPFVLFCVANANTVYNFNAPGSTYVFSVDQGGDNALYSLIGPNVYLFGGGTAFCSGWCSGAQFAPGSTLLPDLNIDFESSTGIVQIGRQAYSGSDVILFISSISTPSFTFPMGGNVPTTFTVVLPAKFSVVQAETTTGVGQLFNVHIPQGKLVLTFNYVPSGNGQPASYVFSQGEYVVAAPEPGTLGLLATGLAGVLRLTRRKSRN
jgi:hypothetical protein